MNILNVGQQVELYIVSLGSNGEGVAKFEGLTVFVAGALPQEKVVAKIVLVKHNYAVAKLVEILEQSPERVKPYCKIYESCGGCQLQHLSYAGQLAVKRQQVADALQHIGHLNCEVRPVLAMDNPWGYRNKMQFPVSGAMNKLAIGCYAVKSHCVIDTEKCLIQQDANNTVLAGVRLWMQKYGISSYNEKNRNGLVRHVMGRVTRSGVMAVIITASEKLPYQDELTNILCKQVPNLKSVVQNINDKHSNVIMGNKSKIIWGDAYIKENINNLHFDISAESFFQVNTGQAEVLYNEVQKCAELTGTEIVIDVYCGTGTISLILAGKAKKVYGIEIVSQAINNAGNNAVANKINNVTFKCGDATIELPLILGKGVQPDLIVVDPPRAGCDEKVLRAIMNVNPKKIIYVSCNPATLARDLVILTDGYSIDKVQPVDMFPQTTHIETVVRLKQR
ncbi:MAG: 23S rRNA (uracil(1939)-C(5))-methyltransferase RlmD [Phascolarctobacterium sp.]|nr:23S rRNA (uracil(1939)-C(5))-methyltransferase RlmD [Candidatus Phascolarctobacterium caballi]